MGRILAKLQTIPGEVQTNALAEGPLAVGVQRLIFMRLPRNWFRTPVRKLYDLRYEPFYLSIYLSIANSFSHVARTMLPGQGKNCLQETADGFFP